MRARKPGAGSSAATLDPDAAATPGKHSGTAHLKQAKQPKHADGGEHESAEQEGEEHPAPTGSALPRLQLGDAGKIGGDITPGAAAPAQGPAAPTSPAAKPAGPLKITSETQASGLPTKRTVLGIGEEVKLTGTESGSWVATTGRPASAEGDTFLWTAPGKPTNVTITLTVDKKKTTIQFAIVAPASIKYKKNYDMSFASGQGVGMYMNMDLSPKTVSFQNVMIKEIPGPASGVWGYFRKKSDLGHVPTNDWTGVGDGNVLEGEDQALMSEWPPDLLAKKGDTEPTLYSQGGLSWVIPNHYAVKGEEGGDGTKFAVVTQSMQINDKKGSSTLNKDGSQAVNKK